MSGDDDIQLSDVACPKCTHETYTRECWNCEDGFSYHDCGEDCCCCLNPEPNVRCDMCSGHGAMHWCRTCGWDLLKNRYINGIDERYRNQPIPPEHRT